MIRVLRKRHLQIWSVWAALIPAGIVVAWMAIKRPIYDSIRQPLPSEVYQRVLGSVEKESYVARIRVDDTNAQQLEWINKTGLVVPSAVIYRSDSRNFRIDSSELIGRIESTGNYYFPIKADSLKKSRTYFLFDFIHQQVIDTINFEK